MCGWTVIGIRWGDTTSGTKATGRDHLTEALTGWGLTTMANNIMLATGMEGTAESTMTTIGTRAMIGTAIDTTKTITRD
jgi:hypothetical protein